MGFIFRLEDYEHYQQRVGAATYLDVTRRTDPARIERVWDNLRAVIETYGPPWVVQLWTKDAAGTLTQGQGLLDWLRRQGTVLTAHVTVTGLGGTEWEPRVPTKPFAGVADLISLLGGTEYVTWRYDPVIPTVHDPARFAWLAEEAAGLGLSRCVINFLAPPGRYKRVDARLGSVLPGWQAGMPGYDTAWRVAVATRLVALAQTHSLRVATCAESAHLAEQVPGLYPAACGDHAWFVRLSGRDPGRAPSRGSRPGCGCAAYFDVGLYGQRKKCHGCLYCYAG